jgi:hypothetical protein
MALHIEFRFLIDFGEQFLVLGQHALEVSRTSYQIHLLSLLNHSSWKMLIITPR